jgi:hypothetical protein
MRPMRVQLGRVAGCCEDYGHRKLPTGGVFQDRLRNEDSQIIGALRAKKLQQLRFLRIRIALPHVHQRAHKARLKQQIAGQ